MPKIKNIQNLTYYWYLQTLCICISILKILTLLQVTVVVQSLSHVQFFATLRTTEYQVSLSFAVTWSLLKLMPIKPVIPSNNLKLCHLLLLPSIFPSMRVFSSESVLHIK